MGFFDFLKKKELDKIKYLENKVKDLENQTDKYKYGIF
nr:MAG TPA: Transmembrane and coiled-coil domain-containing protein 2 [Caudoviricetes sp.]